MRLAVVVALAFVLVLAVAAGLILGRSGGEEDHSAIELDSRSAPPGGTLRLRVVVPEDTDGRADTLYGVDALLERRSGLGRWVPEHHLSFAHRGPPTSAPYGDPRWVVPAVGFSGTRRWTLRVPSDAAPGRYRVVKEVGERRHTAELTVRRGGSITEETRPPPRPP